MSGHYPYGYGVLMAYQSYVEDFNKRRLTAKAMVKIHFAEPWQWRVAIDGLDKISNVGKQLCDKLDTHHPLFEILAKEISYGPLELETEAIKAGGIVFTFPTASSPTTVTLTMRDTNDRLVYQVIKQWSELIANADGTHNLPNAYIKKLTLYKMLDDQASSDIAHDIWEVYPQKMGDITQAVDGEGFIEFPVIFMQFRSLKAKAKAK